MKVVEQHLFVCQIAVTVHEEREMSDSWVDTCSRFLPQTWIEKLGPDPV